MYTTGKKRTTIQKHFLENALQNILNGRKAVPAQTEPIGCFIES
jgi:hypothetical protein